MSEPTVTEEVKRFVKERGLVRPRDLEQRGYPTYLLYRLRDRGELIQLSPGVFKHPDMEVSGKHTYAEAAKRVPRGVVCLLSALAFHDVGVQMPGEVWMALNRDEVRTRPRVEAIPVEFVWFSGAAFHEGQEAHEVEGVEVPVYSPAKTVADLFKFRRKLGTDIAIEALHAGWEDRLYSMDDLERFAELCGVRSVMKPYLESIVVSP